MFNQEHAIELSDVQAAKSVELHASHPFKNTVNHTKLRNFLFPRISLAAKARDSRVRRYIEVDKQLYGWIRLSQEDLDRKSKKDRGIIFIISPAPPRCDIFEYITLSPVKEVVFKGV